LFLLLSFPMSRLLQTPGVGLNQAAGLRPQPGA
jgi:hypothetical protein